MPVVGEPIVTPTWVGARSVGMMRPGRASNSVEIVRYRGLKFGLSRPGIPGSLPTNRYMLAQTPEGVGQLMWLVDGRSTSYMPLKSDSTVCTRRLAKS